MKYFIDQIKPTHYTQTIHRALCLRAWNQFFYISHETNKRDVDPNIKFIFHVNNCERVKKVDIGTEKTLLWIPISIFKIMNFPIVLSDYGFGLLLVFDLDRPVEL